MVPTTLLLIDYIVYLEGFIGSMFAFYEQSFWKKAIFSFDLFLSALSLNWIPTNYYTLKNEWSTVPCLYVNQDYQELCS